MKSTKVNSTRCCSILYDDAESLDWREMRIREIQSIAEWRHQRIVGNNEERRTQHVMVSSTKAPEWCVKHGPLKCSKLFWL